MKYAVINNIRVGSINDRDITVFEIIKENITQEEIEATQKYLVVKKELDELNIIRRSDYDTPTKYAEATKEATKRRKHLRESMERVYNPAHDLLNLIDEDKAGTHWSWRAEADVAANYYLIPIQRLQDLFK